MDKELKKFLEIEGIKKNLSLKGLVKLTLKYQLYFLLLCIYWLAIKIGKAKDWLLATSYGVLKPCKRCVWGKSKESLCIYSIRGYSRDNKVLTIMNYKGKNWTNTGNCIGANKCQNCIIVIDGDDKSKPCVWKGL